MAVVLDCKIIEIGVSSPTNPDQQVQIWAIAQAVGPCHVDKCLANPGIARLMTRLAISGLECDYISGS